MKRIATTAAAILMTTGIAFANEIIQDRVEAEKKTHSSSTVTTVAPLRSPTVQEKSSSSMKTEKESSSTIATDPVKQPEVKERTSSSITSEDNTSTIIDPTGLPPVEQKKSNSVRIEEKSSTVDPRSHHPAPAEEWTSSTTRLEQHESSSQVTTK